MRRLREDIRAIRSRDPAARSTVEILLTYPGLHAVQTHRLASTLHRRGHTLSARLISHLGRAVTGIEIHPGATLGRRLVIDHGMGVVIGETAVVGDDVTIYQGVTLGGTGKQRGKRHPTIGNGVIIGVGASVLGAVQIGDRARVGGGAVVLRDVPPDTTAVGVPAKAVGASADGTVPPRRLERLPDPQRDALVAVLQRVEELEQKVRDLEREAVPRSASPEPSCLA